MTTKRRETTRRDFLKRSATAGALVSIPYVWTSNSAIAQQSGNQPTVAAIGVGGSRGRYSQGGHIARRAAKLGKMIAVCDVDDRHTAEFNEQHGGKLGMYRDYRVLFEKEKPDVVTIGTPDHWHVPIALAALQAGCDVYCEKPLTLTIDEGKIVRQAVADTGKVFQVGTQQRSEDQLRFLTAIAMVKTGRLGDNVNAYVAIGGAPGGGPFESVSAPDDLDWDLWLGPAKKADYCEQRRKMFRWYYDYSGGKMTDWGAHHIDIAQWALGHDLTGPVSVSGSGKFPPLVPDDFNWNGYLSGDVTLPNGFNTPMTFSLDLQFADGSRINVNDQFSRDDGTEFDNGILLEGDAGRIFVNRGRLTGAPIDALSEADREELDGVITQLYKGKRPHGPMAHMQNFFDCLEDRSLPVSDVATHHRTMTSCHLGNIALMLGRDLTWDPEQETFVGDEQATALMSRKRRQGFELSA